jgi:chromosome segregation protein
MIVNGLRRTVERVHGESGRQWLLRLPALLSESCARWSLELEQPFENLSYNWRFLSLRVGDDINPRFVFSSGQRRAAGLAFLLAVHLSRSWCNLRSLILDDPVQHIDDFRALHLVEVLAAVRQCGQQVICTVQDGALADLLCRRLRSREYKDGCLIEMEYAAGEGVKVGNMRDIHPFPSEVLLSA